LIHETCALDAIDAKVDELAAMIAANGPMATRACKRLVADVAGLPISAELRAETARRIADIRVSAEGREGLQSFLQKRAPGWGEAASTGFGAAPRHVDAGLATIEPAVSPSAGKSRPPDTSS
jgi:methylglutaconyl-CoA hydratase